MRLCRFEFNVLPSLKCLERLLFRLPLTNTESFTYKSMLKGARSRYFRQFQHWSNGHRIDLNIKITAQNYRRTRTKHRKDKKGRGWTKLERIKTDFIWVNLENVGPPFFKSTVCQFIHVSKCPLHSWKIILSCYVAMILQNERLLVCQFDV